MDGKVGKLKNNQEQLLRQTKRAATNIGKSNFLKNVAK